MTKEIDDTETSNDRRAACWASEVSPCGGGRSLEHPSPYGMWLQEYIYVKGLPSRPERFKTPVKKLGIKCLCSRHNSETAKLDTALIDLNNCLRRTEELRQARSKLNVPPTRSIRFTCDGRLLERWAAKCVLNFAQLHVSKTSWQPPSWLPEVVFGIRALPDGCGLGLLAKVGDQHAPEDAFEFSFGSDPTTGKPGIAVITLRGGAVRFLFSWDVPLRKINTVIDGEPYSGALALMPFNAINTEPRLCIKFRWKGEKRTDPGVAALRRRFQSPPRNR